MKIYLAICQDRHIDVLVFPFMTRDAAVNRAKQFVSEMSHSDSEIDEEEIACWEYYCRYDEENDVHVVAADLDLPFDPATTVMKRCPDCDDIWNEQRPLDEKEGAE